MNANVAELTDDALFDEILEVEKLGRRFDATGLHQRVVEELDRRLHRANAIIDSAVAKLTGLPGVYVALVANPTFNAWAARNQQRYFVGIHMGLLEILVPVMMRLLADPRTFPHVGDPNVETGALPRYTIRRNVAESVIPAVLPRNTQRAIYAMHLSNLVFDSIVAHEVTHIGHGHVGYKAATFGIPFIAELGPRAGTPDGNYESQAMEMDADFNAAEVVVKNVRRLMSVRDQMPPEIAAMYADPAQAMFDVAAATCILSRLFGDSRFSFSDLVTRDHPPDRWRQLMALIVMGNHTESIWGSAAAGSILAAINRAIIEVEDGFERMTGEPHEVHGLHDVLYGDGRVYSKALCLCWNDTVKPKVEGQAYIKLSTYGFEWPAA